MNYVWHNHSRDFLQTQDSLDEGTNLGKDTEIITLLMKYTVSVRVHEQFCRSKINMKRTTLVVIP